MSKDTLKNEKAVEQLNMKVTGTVKTRFNNLADNMLNKNPELTKNEIVSNMLDFAEVEVAKKSKIVGGKEIKELDYHTSRMLNIYKNIIQRTESMEQDLIQKNDVNVTKLKTTTEEFNEHKKSSKEELTQTYNNLYKSHKENDELEVHVEELKTSISDKDKIILSLEESKKSLEDVTTTLNEQIEVMTPFQDENVKLKDELHEKDLELVKNKNQLDNIETKYDELDAGYSLLGITLKETQNEMDKKEEEHRGILNDIEEKHRDTILELSNNLKLVSDKRDEFNLELTKANSQLDSEKEKTSFFKEELDLLKADRIEYKNEIKLLQATIEKMKSENDNAKGDI